MTSVSVILPTFNRRDLLRSALASLLRQGRPADEIIVVDDGSTDGTTAMVEGFGPRIRYLRKANGGKSDALNLGLSVARGDCIWIFDDDDIARADALERLLAALEADAGAGFAFGGYGAFRSAGGVVTDYGEQRFDEAARGPLHLALMYRCFIHQPGLLVRRRCYDAVGAFRPDLIRSQDYDMILRLAHRFRGVQADGPLFYQRRHEGPRGSAAHPIAYPDLAAAWRRFDRKVFLDLRARCALSDFAVPPGPGGRPAGEERFAALLQRFSLFARRGLWAVACEDLAEAGELAGAAGLQRLDPQVARMLRRSFELLDPTETETAGPHLAAGLRHFACAALRGEVAEALSWPSPYLVRTEWRRGGLPAAMRTAGFFGRTLGAGKVARACARRVVRGRELGAVAACGPPSGCAIPADLRAAVAAEAIWLKGDACSRMPQSELA